MKLVSRPFQSEDDYQKIREFLRKVFLLNNCREHSWHVARLDYWRWHFVNNLQTCDSLDKVITLWESPDGQIAAVLHPVGWGEIRLHVHPTFRSPELETELLSDAETSLAVQRSNGNLMLYTPVFSDDALRQETLTRSGYIKTEGVAHHWRRDLEAPLPLAPVPPGYEIRSMGGSEAFPNRSWASWRAFHAEEPDERYDGDYSWYQNIQSAPLYRRELDIVATSEGVIVSFCTIFYDDPTRSAVCVLVGTAAEHWRRGLGKAVMIEGMRRLKKLGCRWVFATAHDPPAEALYRSVMQTHQVTETWRKEMTGKQVVIG